MSAEKKKIKLQPKDGSTSSPQDMEESKEAGQALDEVEKRDLKDLAEDIIAAHNTRVKIVGEIIEDTHQMMANFK